jgi:hypothetical protein
VIPFQWLAATLCGWIQGQPDDVIAFLREENRVFKAQLRGRRLQLSDPERRRLATLGHRLGRRALADVATIVSPDTLLRWHRELVVRPRMYAGRCTGRPRVHAQIRSLTVRMASENSTWDYTRIQGALKNLGHHVGRSTIARILKEHGVPPSGQRPMAWRMFVRAHWPALIDFFKTERSTVRGLVTACAGFIIGRRWHRVSSVDSTPSTHERLHAPMRQFTRDGDRVFGHGRQIWDADPKRWGTVVLMHASTKAPVSPAANFPRAEPFVRNHEKRLDGVETAREGRLDGHPRPSTPGQSRRTESSRFRSEPIERRRREPLHAIRTAVSDSADGQLLLLDGRVASRTNIRVSGQHAGRRGRRPRLEADIRRLVVRMATENATWGYTRIQGALKNLGYHVGRSSIARILKEHSIPPSGRRPMTWRTFVRAHWPALLDLFATDVSTIRGSVRHCAAWVMALLS